MVDQEILPDHATSANSGSARVNGPRLGPTIRVERIMRLTLPVGTSPDAFRFKMETASLALMVPELTPMSLSASACSSKSFQIVTASIRSES